MTCGPLGAHCLRVVIGSYAVEQAPGFDEASVLDLVNKLHIDNPAKMMFRLGEIAEAMDPEGIAAAKANPNIKVLWIESLNNILKKLGVDRKLTVITKRYNDGVERAIVTFPASL